MLFMNLVSSVIKVPSTDAMKAFRMSAESPCWFRREIPLIGTSLFSVCETRLSSVKRTEVLTSRFGLHQMFAMHEIGLSELCPLKFGTILADYADEFINLCSLNITSLAVC